MSLSDELQAEDAVVPPHHVSQIDVFLDALPKGDRAEVDAWIAARKPTTVLYRVLKRRGLPVADSTFRNWVIRCR